MKKSFFLFLQIFLLFLCGCRNSEQKSATTVFSSNIMTIDYRIIIGRSLNNDEKKQVEAIINSTFDEGNKIFNKWNPDSELSQLNKMKAGETRPLSPQLYQLLKQTQEIVEISGGLFDPTIEPLQELWKSYLNKGQEPPQYAINEILPEIGWNHIHFEKGIFFKDNDHTALDLGGIAKGYIVDLLADRLKNSGYPDVFVEWGGEIRTTGKHPDNRDWNVFISNEGDVDPDHAVAIVTLKDQAIATSGDYNQYWTIGDSVVGEPVVYFHIINPKTHRPLQKLDHSISSVSVLASTCTLADGLATTAMMFPTVEEARAWSEQVQQLYPDIVFWFVSHKG